MKLIGITGQIGTGKSTAAAAFARHKIAVFDADAHARALTRYPDGPALPLIAAAFPQMVKSGQLDRKALAGLVFQDKKAKLKLESILHPLIDKARRNFIKRAYSQRRSAVVLDIPLLQEKRMFRGPKLGAGKGKRLDALLVSFATPLQQKKRVMARKTLDEKSLKAVLQNQWPQKRKCAHGDYVIYSGRGKGALARQIKGLIASHGWLRR